MVMNTGSATLGVGRHVDGEDPRRGGPGAGTVAVGRHEAAQTALRFGRVDGLGAHASGVSILNW